MLPQCPGAAAFFISFLLLLDRQSASAVQRQVAFSVVEEQPEGSLVGSILDRLGSPGDAGGEDAAQAQGAHFGIIPNKGDRSSGATFFDLDTSGNIRVKKRIDRDTLDRCDRQQLQQPCTLAFQAFRLGSSAQMLHTTIDVRITVLDVNDNAPAWSKFSLEARLSEDHPVRQPFKVEAARDPDFGLNGTINYELLDPTGTFSVVSGGSYSPAYPQDSEFININVDKPLDRERIEKYNLTLVAKDSASAPLSATIKLYVIVEDINDHAPVFNQSHYRVSIPETTPYRKMILQLQASDPDKGRNGDVEYSFADGVPSAVRTYFRLDRSLGQLFLKQALDYDLAETRLFEFSVVARDRAQIQRSSTAQVVVAVLDENDCSPQFTVYQYSKHVGMRETNKLTVPEDTAPLSLLGIASVVDNDSGDGGEADCEIQHPMKKLFKLNLLQERLDSKQKTYQIISCEGFDREKQDSFRVQIVCRDRGSPPLSSSYDLYVEIQDINDERPTFAQGQYEFQVKENLPALSHVGSVTATDLDAMQNSRVSYEIDPHSPDAKLFRINSRGEIQTTTPLDREQKPELSVTVIAKDHGVPPLNASVRVFVWVQDDNDAEPKFGRSSYTFEIFEGEPADTIVGNLTATDEDAGQNANLTYSIYSLGNQIVPFRVVSLLGGRLAQIRTIAEIDREGGALALASTDEKFFSFNVRATDHGYRPLTGNCLVKVVIRDRNDNSPEWIVPSAKLRAVNVSRYEDIGRVFINLRAVDPDDGDFGRIRYSVLEGDSEALFVLDASDGGLQIRRSLPGVKSYRLTLAATDCVGCNVSRSSQAVLTVNVVDLPRDTSREHRGEGPSGVGGGSSGGGGRRRSDGLNEQLIIGLIGCTVAIALLAICAILLARCFLARMANTGAKRDTEKRQREAETTLAAAHQEALLFADSASQQLQYPVDTALRRHHVAAAEFVAAAGSPHDSGKGGSIDGTCDVTRGCGYQASTLANFDKIYVQQQQQRLHHQRHRQTLQHHQQYTTLLPTASHQLPQYYEVVRGGGETMKPVRAALGEASVGGTEDSQQQRGTATLGSSAKQNAQQRTPHPPYQASSFV